MIKPFTRTLRRQRLSDLADCTGIGSPITFRTDFASCWSGPVSSSVTWSDARASQQNAKLLWLGGCVCLLHRFLSPAGTLLVAEAACRANSNQILEKIIEEEKTLRHKCKNGAERRNPLTGEQESTSPEYEYWWYRRSEKPTHELLRQWCGHGRSRTVRTSAETR
jgi:hypothetical protein